MESEKAESKVAVVAKAVGHAFVCFDYVVDAFDGDGSDGFVEISLDAPTMGLLGFGLFDVLGDM